MQTSDTDSIRSMFGSPGSRLVFIWFIFASKLVSDGSISFCDLTFVSSVNAILETYSFIIPGDSNSSVSW
ncbi:hypothetical protein D3C86_2132410 [compost metagenome]